MGSSSFFEPVAFVIQSLNLKLLESSNALISSISLVRPTGVDCSASSDFSLKDPLLIFRWF